MEKRIVFQLENQWNNWDIWKIPDLKWRFQWEHRPWGMFCERTCADRWGQKPDRCDHDPERRRAEMRMSAEERTPQRHVCCPVNSYIVTYG